MTESKLLDLNDLNESHKKIFEEMLEISLQKNPKWFRYLWKRSLLIQKYTGYNLCSRAWEYPWAINVAAFKYPCRILDVGGGGSPFANYLAMLGHDCYVIDPSLRNGKRLVLDKNKSILKNLRSFIYRSMLKLLKINSIEGLSSIRASSIKYFTYKADCIKFPDNYFDRVFCLSVIEHIPREEWKKCMQEFERVLKPGGRLIITMDMGVSEANQRLYLKLVDYCTLTLFGNPDYDVPISKENKRKRHGHSYETIGLVWES